MWISKKRWQTLEKRVADLEEQVQGQLEVKLDSKKCAKLIWQSLLEATHDTHEA